MVMNDYNCFYYENLDATFHFKSCFVLYKAISDKNAQENISLQVGQMNISDKLRNHRKVTIFRYSSSSNFSIRRLVLPIYLCI